MFLEEWRALSARVRALGQASELHASYLQGSGSDHYGAYKFIGQSCFDIAAGLGLFAATYKSQLPPTAVHRIIVFLAEKGPIFTAASNDEYASRTSIVMLLSVIAEIDFLLHDRQAQIRSRAERAFLHLQRVLATNIAARAAWSEAFDRKGEVECEALGGTHLLWHGIFAFKVDARGARTDLVFGGAIDEMDEARASDGLVLTEWKVAEPNEGRIKFQAAKKQSDLYKVGALATLELTTTRYLIAVSREKLPLKELPDDFDEGGVCYRHLNIVIEPKTPSKAALAR
jgi:hypothetical protein